MALGDDAPQTTEPDQSVFYRGLSVPLGKPTAVTLFGEQPTAAGPGAAAPVTGPPPGLGGASSGGGGGAPKWRSPQQAGATLARIVQALGLGETTAGVADKLRKAISAGGPTPSLTESDIAALRELSPETTQTVFQAVAGTPIEKMSLSELLANPKALEAAMSGFPAGGASTAAAALPEASAVLSGAGATTGAIAGPAGLEGAVSAGAAPAAGGVLSWLPYAGAALSSGLDIANVAQNPNLSDSEKAALAAADVGRAVGSIASFGASTAAEGLIQLFGGPSPNEFLSKLFGFGPSESWVKFPGKVAHSPMVFGQQLGTLGAEVLRATSPEEIAAAVARYKGDVASARMTQAPGGPSPVDAGGYGGVGGYGRGSGPYDLPALPGVGSKVHGVSIPWGPRADAAVEGLRGQVAQLIKQRLDALQNPPVATAPAAAPPSIFAREAAPLGATQSPFERERA